MKNYYEPEEDEGAYAEDDIESWKNDGKVFPFFVFIGIYYKKTYASWGFRKYDEDATTS
jgi:hypothetical protein